MDGSTSTIASSACSCWAPSLSTLRTFYSSLQATGREGEADGVLPKLFFDGRTDKVAGESEGRELTGPLFVNAVGVLEELRVKPRLRSSRRLTRS